MNIFRQLGPDYFAEKFTYYSQRYKDLAPVPK